MDKLKAITIADNEAFLRQKSAPVDLKDNKLSNNISVLDQFCKENDVMAMAAIQLGIPKRLIYLKNTNLEIINKMQSNRATEEEQNYNESRVLINPVIIKAKGHTRFIERCESCLDYVAIVDRPYLVEVEYYDVNGNKIHETFEGFKATVFSHEYDHLNGILHIDLSNDVRKMTWDETKKYREEHPYEIISKDDDFYLT